MAVTPIFSYTPQNATLIAGMLVGYSTATADPDSNSGTWSPWNGITEIGDIGNSGAFVKYSGRTVIPPSSKPQSVVMLLLAVQTKTE